MKSRLAEDLADIPELRVSRIYSRNPEAFFSIEPAKIDFPGYKTN